MLQSRKTTNWKLKNLFEERRMATTTRRAELRLPKKRFRVDAAIMRTLLEVMSGLRMKISSFAWNSRKPTGVSSCWRIRIASLKRNWKGSWILTMTLGPSWPTRGEVHWSMKIWICQDMMIWIRNPKLCSCNNARQPEQLWQNLYAICKI